MVGIPNIENLALVSIKPKPPQSVGNKVVAKRSVTKINCDVIIVTSHVIQETCVGGYMESLKCEAKGTNFLVIMDMTCNSQLNQLRIKMLGTQGIQNDIFVTEEQLNHLYRFMSQTEISSNPTSSFNLAQASNFLTALHTSNLKSDPWIIDSGATYHMSGSSNLFSSYIPCSGDQKVKLLMNPRLLSQEKVLYLF